ncbi:RNA-directed DNA polymerase (Reverse transcriptase), Ribonuclease H [Gossypium australe]|uniref:RNA-directed DNA polymerase (Reverse transcriptase), Ribonuclease H n=1 Tax=Gossypium australe TaxID=47621 RepID=A0A5B6WTP7_9ROSI|nr:RNA-directed DNA polymerase (Reverse transcriptase), Ribonuclease H [Gossypium australe]
MYQKRMMRAYNKKVIPREFHEGDLERPYVVKKAFARGALILTEVDGKSLPNPMNPEPVKKYFT